jgi:hypothetical protein
VHRIGSHREGDAVFDLEVQLGAEVVPEILADAGEMLHRGDPKGLQLVRGADAREHGDISNAGVVYFGFLRYPP